VFIKKKMLKKINELDGVFNNVENGQSTELQITKNNNKTAAILKWCINWQKR